MAHKVNCYLKSINSLHSGICLPHLSPVVIGRMPELHITDKSCSRNQLELNANYDKKYVVVKRLGVNPSQIEGIDIGRHKTSLLRPGQTLYVANMNYPHCVVFEEIEKDNDSENKDSCEAMTSKSANLYKRKQTSAKNDEDNEKSRKTNLVHKEDNNLACCDLHGMPGSHTDNKTSVNTFSSASSSAAVPSFNKPINSTHWSQGLKASMCDPSVTVFRNDQVVVIEDKYPKAKYHWLVLPLSDISNINQLDGSHLYLVKHLLEIGKEIAEKEKKSNSSLTFRYGFHAVASMSHLHMHVISQDFSSACLKNKKHWNSFTTDYFVDADSIIDELETAGKVKDRRSYTKFLKEPLKCHLCHQPQKNMPTLKRHIQDCKG